MALIGSKSTTLAANCFTLPQFAAPRLPEESKMNNRSTGLHPIRDVVVVRVELVDDSNGEKKFNTPVTC